jgi:hypothetical protein
MERSLERDAIRLAIEAWKSRPGRMTESFNDYGASRRCFQGEHE